MRSTTRRLGIFAALVWAASGCLGPTLPIPPPGATVSAISCPASECPSDGVIVHIEGTARPGALVVAENLTRGFADGRRYSAAAYATTPSAGTDAGTTPGRYVIELGPMAEPGAPTSLVSRRGDTIAVYQLVRDGEGRFIASDVAMERVR